MFYQLWHNPSTNFMDEFDSIEEAADVLDAAVRRDGPGFLTDTYLVVFDEAGEEHLVAQGEAILVTVKRLAAEERRSAEGRFRKVG